MHTAQATLTTADHGASALLNADQQQYLTFTLGGETYAMAILSVKEIIDYGHITEVPRMPGFILGVINLRGAVVPVIDLSTRFGKPPTPITRRSCIVIIEVSLDGQTHDIGVKVDAVNAVLEIPPSEIEPPPSFGSSIRPSFISGMGKVNGRFVIILAVDQVLSVEEIAALAAGESAGQDALTHTA